MVKSINRALELLFIIGSSNREGCSIADLSKSSGLAPSTVHRLLSTLKEQKFILQDENTQMYYLGPSLMILGMKARGNVDLRRAAVPILKSLTKETEEDSYLTISEGDRGIFLERVEGPHPLKVLEAFGTQVPLHCGSMRKVLLAYKSQEFINSYIHNGLSKYTENTIINPDALQDELVKIREQGYATSYEEYIKQGAGVAVPVKDMSGDVIASIGIIGPVSRISKRRLPSLVKEVEKKARELSYTLGYEEDSED